MNTNAIHCLRSAIVIIPEVVKWPTEEGNWWCDRFDFALRCHQFKPTGEFEVWVYSEWLPQEAFYRRYGRRTKFTFCGPNPMKVLPSKRWGKCSSTG